MERLIIRNDDVSKNTSLTELNQIYNTIYEVHPTCEIWSALNVLSYSNDKGSVYPNIPLKNQPLEYFYNVNQYIGNLSNFFDVSKVVSHGLWHFDHSKVSHDLQKASILTSCHILMTETFVPPFNKWNQETDQICKDNGINLIKYEDGWKSFEYNDFDPNHKKWYFHSWKWDSKTLYEYLTHSKVSV